MDVCAAERGALTPQKPGTYEMHCTHPFHSMLGMKGQIVVR